MDYKQQQSLNEAINKIFYSEKDTTLCLDEALDEAEDNTAAIAKQVKKAVKKYTTGKLVVRSKGGKTRFIMVLSDKIDNELRKMMLDVVSPNANVRDEDDISYGNISDRIISASADAWVKALGLKEEAAVSSLDEKSFRDFTTPASPSLVKWIESGKVKILQSAVSDLGPTTKFVVVDNPKWFGGDKHDPVLMFTISDPEKGRIKMFAFHGSHVSQKNAMKFATNNKLIVKESVLDEVTRMAVDKEFVAVTRSGKMDTMAAIKHLEKKFGITDVRVDKDKNGKSSVVYFKESVLDELDEVTSIASSVESRKKVTKVLKKKGIGFHTSKGDIMVNPKNMIAAKKALNKEFAGDFETNSGMKLKATKKVGISDEVELDEAWTADSVIRNAEIGSKKGYGINIKKTGEITKTPYKHMLMKTKRGGNVIVTFDFGKDEFEGTPKSVALYVNKILGIKESVLDEVASRETETAKNIAKKGKKLGDWVNKSYYEYEGNIWVLGGYGNDAVNRGPIDKAKKDLSDILLKKLKF